MRRLYVKFLLLPVHWYCGRGLPYSISGVCLRQIGNSSSRNAVSIHPYAQQDAFRFRDVCQFPSVLAMAGLKLLPEHGAYSPFCNRLLKLFIVALRLVSVKFGKLR